MREGEHFTTVVIPPYAAWETLPAVLDALEPQAQRGDREVIVVESSGDGAEARDADVPAARAARDDPRRRRRRVGRRAPLARRDRALRARVGKAGRAWIERHHDSDEAARRLVALLGLEDAVRPAR